MYIDLLFGPYGTVHVCGLVLVTALFLCFIFIFMHLALLLLLRFVLVFGRIVSRLNALILCIVLSIR